MNEYEKTVHKITILFNCFLWFYQVFVSLLCYQYHVKLLMIVLIVNFFFTNFNYFMLARKNYRIVTILMYIEIIAVMAAGTVSLGISYGFFLYGISLLTIFFYVNYIGVKIKTGKINEKLMVGSILLAYAVSIVYTAKYGPMYEINNATAFSFFAGNSICVFTLVNLYTVIMAR